MKTLRAVAITLLALSGCSGFVRVGPVSPRPNVDLPRSRASLGLDVSAVRDNFEIPEQNGVTSVPVEQWQSTVRAGFANGIAPFFLASPTPDFTLRFLKADLEYTPVAIYERSGGAAAVRARVTYMAQLIDRNGQIVARLKGEALSKNPWVDAGGSERTASEAVARMFEEIADEGLRALPSGAAAPPPAAVVPPPVAAPTGPAPASEFTEFPGRAPPAADCIPACRTGFFCYQGTCKSSCNPPCPNGERCTAKGECVKH